MQVRCVVSTTGHEMSSPFFSTMTTDLFLICETSIIVLVSCEVKSCDHCDERDDFLWNDQSCEVIDQCGNTAKKTCDRCLPVFHDETPNSFEKMWKENERHLDVIEESDLDLIVFVFNSLFIVFNYKRQSTVVERCLCSCASNLERSQWNFGDQDSLVRSI